MVCGYYAIYKGITFSAGILQNGKIILRNSGELHEELGVNKCEPFTLPKTNEIIIGLKEVEAKEITSMYKVKLFGHYCGYKFQILNEKNDMFHIFALYQEGDYRDWRNLKMEQIGKDEYAKWVPKNEVETFEEKEIIELNQLSNISFTEKLLCKVEGIFKG
jgi:hypothetical protein